MIYNSFMQKKSKMTKFNKHKKSYLEGVSLLKSK